MPVTTPVLSTTCAMARLELLHMPGAVAGGGLLVNVTVEPWQMLSGRLMGVGGRLTFTMRETKHPVGNIYSIVPDVPGVLLVTDPVGEMAIEGLKLHHEPPGVESDNTVVYPTHTAVCPVIGRGNGLTVTA